MDEWDEFLSRAASEDVTMASAGEDGDKVHGQVIQTETVTHQVYGQGGDLGDFGDNAEVLMQMARGESLNQLSSNGIWINSTSNHPPKPTSSGPPSSANGNAPHQSAKRQLKGSAGLSVPIANSFQDFARALSGHPLLSHPLSLLARKQHTASRPIAPLYEIDSMGLFFYGSAGELVRVESNVKDDFMKVIEMKRILLGNSILNTEISGSDPFCLPESDAQIIISFDNLKILSGSIPPNGKSSWILPFEVSSSGSINLTHEAITPMAASSSSSVDLFYEFSRKSIEKHLSSTPGLLEESDHFILIEDFKVLVKTTNPAFNISTNFRGSCHSDPSTESLNFLFYRQSNYSIEIDFESLKIASIKSFVPKFDQQNRLFLLLKGLRSKLLLLPEGRFYLAHTGNCPFIKVLTGIPIDGKEPLEMTTFK